MATVPGQPSKPVVVYLTDTDVRLKWNDPSSNGGSPITARQIGYSVTSSGQPTSVRPSNRDDLWQGFQPGVTVYFRSRVMNAVGFSLWSLPAPVTFLNEPNPPGFVRVSEITQVSAKVEFTDGGSGGTAILERQVGYSLTSGSLPTNTFTYTGPKVLTNLKPGTVHYFRSRTRNSIGWSAWSNPSAAKTIAGAWVKVGNTYKEAVPYVKYNGVWRVARPWARLFGFWQESS